ncbi:LysM peptidoglycan-binding domain-containing protein [Niallia oryzisoli]|uniref:LysM peptidoglycan-binding domain-containing protein n=1 Tax=Niallia oryzisoli TaxID=1737571 RepID=A0ABZ2C6Q4_9BACI
MKRKWLSIAAASAFFIVGTTNVHAEQVVVHKGDTLWGIAKENEVSVESIKEWNNLSSDLIHPNDLLEVSPIKHLLVTKGDNLWNIAQVYGVSVDDLKTWNNLTTDLIHPGLDLTIYTSENAVPVAEQAVPSNPAPTESAAQAASSNQAPTESAAQAASSNPAPTEPAAQAAPSNPAPAEPAAQAETTSSNGPTGKEVMVEATAYTANCEGCSGITKTGVDLNANPDAKVIAVDPAVIPLGSKVYVEGYGYATAADIGGGINGHEIDIYVQNHNDAIQWGRKTVKVTIID